MPMIALCAADAGSGAAHDSQRSASSAAPAARPPNDAGPPRAARPTVAALAARLTPLTRNLRSNGHLLRCELPPHTLTVFPDGRALIQGTTDIALARSLYARLIGS